MMWGHNLPPLVEIGLTDVPKSGGSMAPPATPGTTGPVMVRFRIRYVIDSCLWPSTHQNCDILEFSRESIMILCFKNYNMVKMVKDDLMYVSTNSFF